LIEYPKRVGQLAAQPARVVHENYVDGLRCRRSCLKQALEARPVIGGTADRLVGIDVGFQYLPAFGPGVFAALADLVVNGKRALFVGRIAGIDGAAELIH
jgi:hypothetical protein